jgi:hypothetical protein
MIAIKERADPPRRTPPRADRELLRRNRRTALLPRVLVLGSLASGFCEFDVVGNRRPLRPEKK